MPEALPEWRTPPNLVTLARIALTPYIGYAVGNGQGVVALALVFIAGMSDAFDGFLARRFHWESKLGAYLDPLADKALLVTLYVAFAVSGALPVWLVSLVILRDLWILSMVSYAWFSTTIRDFPPRWSGKASTAAQLLLAGGLLLEGVFPGLPGEAFLGVLVVSVTVLAAISGVDYTVVAIRRYASWRRANMKQAATES